jgi:hypothetical protein
MDNEQHSNPDGLAEFARRPARHIAREVTGRHRCRLKLTTAAAVVMAAVGLGFSVVTSSNVATASVAAPSINALGHVKAAPAPAPGPLGPEGVPIPKAEPLASTATAVTGQSVSGIMCATTEQLVFHVHTHLTIFVNGVAKQIPYGIGIPGAETESTPSGPFVDQGSCFYYLHTHAADGIIHIESPVQRTYTLGNFFDEWGQPLSRHQVGPAHGRVVALYNGRVYKGSLRSMPLGRHVQIQLDVGSPLVAPEKITFPPGL